MGVTTIEKIAEDGWLVLREVRLRALRDNADAWGSSLAREEAFREQHWRMRLRSSSWYVARDTGTVDGRAVGLACLIQEPASPPDDRHVIALWVDPERRREGLASALLAATADEAVRAGSRTLSLWVADTNAGAVALCGARGFTATGERQRSTRDPHHVESRYERDLVTR